MTYFCIGLLPFTMCIAIAQQSISLLSRASLQTLGSIGSSEADFAPFSLVFDYFSSSS